MDRTTNQVAPQGIVSGTYYMRKPGPESAPIVGAEEWGPLIRRCVLNEKDKLLSDFSLLMQYAPSTKVDGAEELTNWHQNCEKRFLELLSDRDHVEWPVPASGKPVSAELFDFHGKRRGASSEIDIGNPRKDKRRGSQYGMDGLEYVLSLQ